MYIDIITIYGNDIYVVYKNKESHVNICSYNICYIYTLQIKPILYITPYYNFSTYEILIHLPCTVVYHLYKSNRCLMGSSI